MSTDQPSEREVSDALKKEFIATSYATTPIQRDGKTPEEINQTFAENVYKHFSPGFQYIIQGAARSRDGFIEAVSSIHFLEVNYHDQKFTREGDTILMQGLFDCVTLYKGTRVERHNDYYCDVLTFVNNNWLTLSSMVYQTPTGPGFD